VFSDLSGRMSLGTFLFEHFCGRVAGSCHGRGVTCALGAQSACQSES